MDARELVVSPAVEKVARLAIGPSIAGMRRIELGKTTEGGERGPDCSARCWSNGPVAVGGPGRSGAY